MAWCEKELGVVVAYKKLYYWFGQWGYRKKVPRPMAEKGDAQAQKAWEKRGLLAALRRGEEVGFADEMRLGMLRQVRRVWGRRGEKQRWRIELRYEWVYLVLGVGLMRGWLWWEWVKRVRGVEIAQVLRAWYGTVRLFTRGRRCEKWGCGGYINCPTLLSSILWSGYLVFEEVRRWVEGRRYERIEAKKAAMEEVLRRLEAEGKVSSLVGWPYIRQALNALPS